MQEANIQEIKERLKRLRAEAEALAEAGQSFPAMWRNSLRILANIRMMEIDLGLSAAPGRNE